MPAQDGLRFLFQIQDKITADLIKIEKKVKASATKIDKAFTRASKAQEANSARIIHREKLRGIAVENAAAKATAARTKETQQGQILAQRLASAQATEARKSAAAEQRRINTVEKAHAKSITLLKRQSAAFKQSMTRLASAATVAFAAVAGKALSMASGYDAAMRSVQAKTQASAEDMKLLTAQSREMGRTTVHSATEAARGQAFLAQAGFDVNEILSALPATLALATAGELGLAEAADIASNVVSGFRLEVDQTGRVSDVLAKSAASANTSVAEMGAAMAKAAPSAASAGWSLEQTAAAIGVLADNAIKGEEGGTLLKTMLAKLAPTTGATAKKLNQLGIEVHTATGRVKPLDEILQALAPHTDNTGLMFELLGTRGANAGLILGSLAEGELDKLTKALEDSEGAAQEMADIMSGGLWGAVKKITSIVESAWISFGERLAPAVIFAANVFADLPGPIQEVVVVTGSLVAMMGGLMLVMPASFGSLVQLPAKLGRLAKMINIVKIKTVAMAVAQKAATAAQWLFNAALHANPIGLVIAAIGLLVVAWLKWDDEIKAFFRVTWSLVKKGFYAFKGWVVEAFGVLKGWLDKIPTPILALLGPVGMVLTVFRHWDDIKEIARSVYRGIRTWLGDRLGYIFKGIKEKVDWVIKVFTKMKDTIVGNSIVPDMVDDIESEFERMNFAMVSEVAEATRVTTVEFGKLQTGLHEAAVVMSTELYEAAKSLEEKQIELAKSAEALRLEEEALRIETEAGTQAASGYDLALAGLAGQMGGATGQALNLVIAMREHNKAQKAAAEAGRETEGEFSKIQVGAATLGLAFTAIGDAIGGTAGKVLSELGGIAQAFATGGIVGGIMAGIGSLIKGIKGLFGRGKRKREKAAKEAQEAANTAAAAAAQIAAAMTAIRLELLGLPTLAITEDFDLLRQVWDKMSGSERARGMDEYAAALQAASAAGIVLTGVEQTLLDAFVAYNAAMTEATARQNAEMAALQSRQAAELAGIDAQIDAIESRLRPKISELQALIEQQEAELASLSARQDAEMAALAERRQAALDSIMAAQAEQLSILKEAQQKELDALNASQAAELSALKAARDASLGVIESAIQRELEDERIAAQLRIDLRKAGGDQEAIDAAHARAATSTERLLERDEMDALMKEAEERIRERYQDEIDTVTAHWDALEALTTKRHQAQTDELEATHADQMTELEATQADQLRAYNAYWDELEELMELRHGFELEALEAAHTAQLEALLAALLEKRDVLLDAHALELADLQASHAAQIAEIESFWKAAKQAELDGRAAADKANAERRQAEEDAARVVPENTDPFDDLPGGFKDPEGYQGYQHGGPVQAGRPVLVGEVGPEIFIPSQSGRIDPNVSNSGGGLNAEDIARAVAKGLQGAKFEADGRKFGRLVVRHQPLASVELGGRR